MSYISKIKVNNTNYDVKDQIVRNQMNYNLAYSIGYVPYILEKGSLNMFANKPPEESAYHVDYRARTPVSDPFSLKAGTIIRTLDRSALNIGLQYFNGTDYVETPWFKEYTMPINSDKVWILTAHQPESGATVDLSVFYDLIRIESPSKKTMRDEYLNELNADGEYLRPILLRGAYDQGAFVSGLYVAHYQKHACSEGDVIRLATNKVVSWLWVDLYNGDTYVNEIALANTNHQMVTIPSGITHFIPCIQWNQHDIIADGVKFSVAINSNLESRLYKLENPSTTNLPSYYTNEWLNAIYNKVNTNNNFANGISFVFITDLHFQANKLKSKDLIKNLFKNTTVPFVICGGDFAPAYGSETNLHNSETRLIEYQEYLGQDRFFSVRGNHDFHITASAGSSDKIFRSWGTVYNYIARKSEFFIANMNTEHLCFCVDVPSQKTRFIMLNTNDARPSSDYSWGISQNQIDWMIDAINDVQNTNIIVVSHAPVNPNMTEGYQGKFSDVIQKICEAVNAKTSLSYTYQSQSVDVDFTNTTNEIVCCIAGHQHCDSSDKLNDVLSIGTTCDACYQDDGYGATANTVTEQAFDVFSIDFDNRTIKATRVGRGPDRNWSY